MNSQMFNKIQALQKELQDANEEINAMVFEAAAGGVVKVAALGNKHLISITVSPSFKAEGPDDYEMLADMIVTACNDIYQQIDKTREEKFGPYAGAMNGSLF